MFNTFVLCLQLFIHALKHVAFRCIVNCLDRVRCKGEDSTSPLDILERQFVFKRWLVFKES